MNSLCSRCALFATAHKGNDTATKCRNLTPPHFSPFFARPRRACFLACLLDHEKEMSATQVRVRDADSKFSKEQIIPDHTLGFFLPEPGPLRGKRSADRDLERARVPDPLECDLFRLYC